MIKNSERGRQKLSLRNILLRMVLKMVCYGGILLVFWYFLDDYRNGAVARGLKEFSGVGFYESVILFILDNKIIVLVALLLVIAFLITYRELRRMMGYLSFTQNALRTLAEDDREPEGFPDDIRSIEVTFQQVRRKIEEKERLAAEAEQRKNDLVVYLAHDLKTPLASVIGYLTLLDEAPDMPAEQRAQYTGIALDKALRLEELINEFFDITRFSLQRIELEKSDVDLGMLLRQIMDEFYPLFEEKGIVPRLQARPNLHVVGDADKLERVFDNLLRNAVAYGARNTELRVEARRGEQYVSVVIKNKGPQIPQEKLERIFEKFFRLDGARRTATGGAGLGLAIARQIAQLHGGSLTAKSGPEWTEFCLCLPAAPLTAAEGGPTAGEREKNEENKKEAAQKNGAVFDRSPEDLQNRQEDVSLP